jgi:hypothetical protein
MERKKGNFSTSGRTNVHSECTREIHSSKGEWLREISREFCVALQDMRYVNLLPVKKAINRILLRPCLWPELL